MYGGHRYATYGRIRTEKEDRVSNTAEETATPAEPGTGAALIAFLNWTIAKNELVDATASALRTGSQKVLSVEDDPNGVDLRAADLDNIVARFRNRHRLDMKERTLEQYEQRFRQSVDMYFKWLDNDPTWKPAMRKRIVRAPNGGQAKDESKEVQKPAEEQVVHHAPHQPGMITYPFPIRPGVQGKISLPEDLTMREAKRIAAFVSTLALEDDPAVQEPRALMVSQLHDDE